MKLEITESGAFDGEGKEIAVGTIVNVKGDELPGWLAGKVRMLSGSKEGKTAVTGDDTLAGGAA